MLLRIALMALYVVLLWPISMAVYSFNKGPLRAYFADWWKNGGALIWLGLVGLSVPIAVASWIAWTTWNSVTWHKFRIVGYELAIGFAWTYLGTLHEGKGWRAAWWREEGWKFLALRCALVVAVGLLFYPLW